MYVNVDNSLTSGMLGTFGRHIHMHPSISGIRGYAFLEIIISSFVYLRNFKNYLFIFLQRSHLTKKYANGRYTV